MASVCGLPKPETLDQLVEGLKTLTERNVEPNTVIDYLQNYKNSDWQEFAIWDPYRYTRNLLGESDKFNLILLCWSEGNASSIHDHTDSECIMKCVQGNVKETRYAWPTKKRTKMIETGLTEGSEGDVIWINDDMGLHRVENPSLTSRMATLHFYWPPIKECLIFDEDTSKARKVKMTWTSVRGVKTPFVTTSVVREST
jgi:cysteine dioxygenase